MSSVRSDCLNMSKWQALVADLMSTPTQSIKLMQTRTLLTAAGNEPIPLIQIKYKNKLILHINITKTQMLFLLNILAWSTLLIQSVLPAVLPIGLLSHIRLAQSLQVLTVLPNLQSPTDILFIVLNIKLMIRLIIVWLILDDNIVQSSTQIHMVVMIWSICECIRYFLENVRTSSTQAAIHNIFAISEPLQLYSNIAIINQYIENNKNLSDISVYGMRALQVVTILYMTINYINRWNERSRFYIRKRNQRQEYRRYR